MKIDDQDFGPVTHDADLDAWEGHLATTAFAGCGIKWQLTWKGQIRERPDLGTDDAGEKDAGEPRVKIVVADGGEGRGPGAAQRAALAAFRAREADVAAAVLAEVARVARESYVTADQLPPDAPALTSQRDLAERLCTADGVREWLNPPRIDVHTSGEHDVAYTSFNFNTGFDEEHGIAVLMLAEQFSEIGGSSEFYNR